MNDNNSNQIQELAIELCTKYHSYKTPETTDESLLSNGELLSLRNKLIESIMSLYQKKNNDSSAWYKICYYVIRSIPRYKYKSTENEYNEFTHFFGKMYKNDFQNIDEEESNSYIRSDVGGSIDDIRYVKRLLKYCNSRGIDIYEVSDDDLGKLSMAFRNRLSIKRLKQLISIATAFSEIGSLSYEDGYDYTDKIGREDTYFSGDNLNEIKFLVDAVSDFSKHYLRKTQIEIVRCLYTNKLATYLRRYVDNDHGEEYEHTAPELEKRTIRANYLQDEFKDSEDELYGFVLYMRYLSYILDEPTPDTIYRVCMNEYRSDERGTRHFTDEAAERFCGMSKGNVKKTYSHKLEEINSIVLKYCQSE